jgi:hypothetical protein
MTYLFKSNILKINGIVLLVLFITSCSKEVTNYVPNVPVYVELDITTDLAFMGVGQIVTIKPDTANTEYSILDFHNKKFPKRSISWQTYNNGIILYHPSPDSYLAFDMTCPYRAFIDDCTIEVDSIPFMPTCKCCKSVFNLLSLGSPVDTSKARKSLFRYNVNITNYATRLIISK